MKFRKEHKGKYFLVAIYALFVFVSPVFIFTGAFQDNAKSLVGWIVKEEDDAFFKSYIVKIQNGEIEKSYSQLHPEVQSAFPIEELEKVALFLASSTDTMEVVGAKINTYTDSDSSRTNYEMTYEIVNNDNQYKFVLAQINAQKENYQTLITGFHVYPREGSIKEQRKVDFLAQWPSILVAIAIPLFIIFSALHYLSRANIPRWLILIMILFLNTYLTISSIKFGINFGFYSFASAQGLWGPIVFNTPIPLGVLIYWIRHKKLNDPKTEMKAVSEPVVNS